MKFYRRVYYCKVVTVSFYCKFYNFRTFVGTYNLERSFRLREMEVSVKLVFPATFLHAISQIIYNIVAAHIRSESSRLTPTDYVISIEIMKIVRSTYTLTCLIVLFVCLQKQKTINIEKAKEMDFTQAYFSQFDRQMKM